MIDTTTNILELMSEADGNRFLAALHIQMNGFLDERTVERLTQLSRTERYRLRVKGDFPDMHRIQGKVKGWRVSDILEWLNSRP